MNAPARLAAFAGALVLTFLGGAALGNAVGPLDDTGPEEIETEETPGGGPATTAPDHETDHP